MVLTVHPTTLEPLSKPSSKIRQYFKTDEILAISNSLKNLIQVGIFIKVEAIETNLSSKENEVYTKGRLEEMLSNAKSSISIQQVFKKLHKCHLCRRIFDSKLVLANHLKLNHWQKLDLQGPNLKKPKKRKKSTRNKEYKRLNKRFKMTSSKE